MRWEQGAQARMTERIQQLGLTECSVCSSGTLAVRKWPALLPIGGFPAGKEDPDRDPEANYMFMVMIICELCGHTMMFDSERLSPGDEKCLEFGKRPHDD